MLRSREQPEGFDCGNRNRAIELHGSTCPAARPQSTVLPGHDPWRALRAASLSRCPCFSLLSYRLMKRSRIISDGLQKPVYGIQIGFAVLCESLAMCRARNKKKLFQRIRRLFHHSFRQGGRHPPVLAARNEHYWNIELPDGGFDVTIVRVKTHSETRNSDNQIRDGKGRQAKYQPQMMSNRFTE